MTHALCAGKGPLPPGLMIQNAYTEMCNGSKNVAIVVGNSTVYPETQKKIPVVRVVAANWVPEPQMWPGTIDMLDEAQGIQTPKMKAGQRQEKLFKKLDLSGLGSWSPELADSAHSLLAKYHDIFSLEPCELSCTHLTKHVIKVTDAAPFKSYLGRFPHHWWKKSVYTCKRHWIQAWFTPARVCSVMLWYWFKRRVGISFLHRLLSSQCLHKEGFLPVAEDPRGTLKFGWCRPFLIPQPEVWILADQDEQVVKAVHCIYCQQPGILQVWLHALWAVQCTSHILILMQNCLGELNLTYCLIYLDDKIITQMVEEHLHHLHREHREHNLKLKPSKWGLFQEQNHLPSSSSLKGWGSAQQFEPESNHRMHPTTYLHQGTCFSWATTGGSSKSSHAPHSPLVSILLERWLAGSHSGCHSPRMPWRLLRHWSRCVWQIPSWCLLTSPNHSCWRLLHPVMDWGLVVTEAGRQVALPHCLWQQALTPHEKYYYSTKFRFLLIKWAVTEHFKDYLPYQSFVVWTDNNLLMYIISMPNLVINGSVPSTQFDFWVRIPKGMW